MTPPVLTPTQLPGRPELGRISPFQKSGSLGDIPFYCSREEWSSLDPAQRNLFWNIKRKNSRDAALGKQVHRAPRSAAIWLCFPGQVLKLALPKSPQPSCDVVMLKFLSQLCDQLVHALHVPALGQLRAEGLHGHFLSQISGWHICPQINSGIQ